MDIDTANVGCTHSGHREESVFPFAVVRNSLVDAEQIGERLDKRWSYTEQPTTEVTSMFDHPVGGRMESMIITGSQVDDCTVQSVLGIARSFQPPTIVQVNYIRTQVPVSAWSKEVIDRIEYSLHTAHKSCGIIHLF